MAIKNKYWVKMLIKENIIDSWIMRCTHMGEVKLYGYILSTFNPNDMSWTYNKFKQQAIEKLFDLKESTVFKYLKLMVKNGLLIKQGKGTYLINQEYIQFGSKKS